MGDFAKDNQLMAVFQTEAVYYLRRSGAQEFKSALAAGQLVLRVGAFIAYQRAAGEDQRQT